MSKVFFLKVAKLVSLAWLLLSLHVFSDEIKLDAPERYTVKKGDTLWQIAEMYLNDPWRWPALWQNNPEIVNPHLIYPGDQILLLRLADGTRTIQLVRGDKKEVRLSPKSQVTQKGAEPLPTLAWDEIKPHYEYDMILEEESYESLPYLLGNQRGAVRFATGDLVLSKSEQSTDARFHILRKQTELLNKEGDSVGVLVKQIGIAQLSPSDLPNQILVDVVSSEKEAKGGDKLLPIQDIKFDEALVLQAATDQVGHILASTHEHSLMGKYDIVILDLGESEIQLGMVMGIYSQGPTIIDGDPIRYQEEGAAMTLFTSSRNFEQPAIKIGELIVIRGFEQASFGLIISSTDVIKSGAFVAKP